MAKKMTAQEKQWRAEDDARTLAEAGVILQDKTRMSAAKKAAQTMAAEAQNGPPT